MCSKWCDLILEGEYPLAFLQMHRFQETVEAEMQICMFYKVSSSTCTVFYLSLIFWANQCN